MLTLRTTSKLLSLTSKDKECNREESKGAWSLSGTPKLLATGFPPSASPKALGILSPLSPGFTNAALML